MYYDTCILCGANLDPGEKCDCSEVQTKEKQSSQARPMQKDCFSHTQSNIDDKTTVYDYILSQLSY